MVLDAESVLKSSIGSTLGNVWPIFTNLCQSMSLYHPVDEVAVWQWRTRYNYN